MERCRQAYANRFGISTSADKELSVVEDSESWWAWRAGWIEHRQRTSVKAGLKVPSSRRSQIPQLRTDFVWAPV